MSKRSVVYLIGMVLLAGVLGYFALFDVKSEQSTAKVTPSPEESSKSPAQGTPAEDQKSDLFSDFRAQRRQSREDEIALLHEITEKKDAPEESVAEANRYLMRLTDFYEQERSIEQQLILRGYGDAFSFVQEELVTVAIRQESLSSKELSQILLLVARITGQESESIKVLPVA